MKTTISSTFDSDLDGWTMNGDVASFTWESTVGNPGGFAHWVDAATGADSYYVAPSKFTGEQSAYYGGTLSYDIEDTGNDISGIPDIELTGDGLTLVYVAGQPNTTWTHFSATLTAAAGWKVGAHDTSVTGDPAATAAQMQEVLANLTSLEIRAEFVSGAESGGLDNVIMTSTGTSAWDLFSSPAKTTFLGTFTTLAGTLAAAHSGDDVAFADAGSGGAAAAFGTKTITVNNLTVEADSRATGTFVLATGVTTFALAGLANINVTGNAAADTITGNSGDNIIYGEGGADTISGGAGNDHIYLNSTPTLVDGGAGTDSIFVQSGVVMLNDTNVVSVEKFLVNGGTLDFSGGKVGRSIISQSAASGAVTMIGSQGADYIHAGAGKDSITGGAGADFLYAGSGADTFHYDASGFGSDSIYNVILAKDTFDVSALGSSLADLHFAATGTGGANTLITGSGDTTTGDSITLIGVTAAQAQANGHFTF